MNEEQKKLRREFAKKQWEDRKKNPKLYSDIKEKMSKADKGRPSPHKGKKFPQLLGNTNGFKKGNKPWNKGLGNKSLGTRIRGSIKYQKWRSDVFQRDNWTCKTCNKNDCTLEAHHKKKFSKILKENNIKTFDEAMNCSELWNINIGVTLCEDCHDLTKRGKQE
jgi:hypothetical protein